MASRRIALPALVKRVRACTVCAESLPHGPRPVLQASSESRILIAGQAPGRRVHESGVPFDDPSGDRLRLWTGLTREQFYDPDLVAILPMGFCFPGSARSGDLPPRKECAPEWREQLLSRLPSIELTLVLGRYAQAYHLPDSASTLTEAVRQWKKTWPKALLLPHPSPRNQAWFKKNRWFEDELLPKLRRRVRRLISRG